MDTQMENKGREGGNKFKGLEGESQLMKFSSNITVSLVPYTLCHFTNVCISWGRTTFYYIPVCYYAFTPKT